MIHKLQSTALIFIFLVFSITLSAQTKFELSFGLGQNYSTIVESFEIPQGNQSIEPGYVYAPAIIAQLGYNINSKSKLVTRQTTQWLGGEEGGEKYHALNLRTPFQFHHEILPKLRLIVGVYFSILYDFRASNNHTFDFAPENRLLMGYTTGLNYTVKEKFDISFSYNKDINSFAQTRFTDNQGMEIGTSKSKLQYFQLAILYKVFS